MKSALRFLPLFALPILITGCSSAPYANETTARSLGQGNWSTQVGATGSTSGLGGVYARQGYGATTNWDIGIDAETTSQQAGVWTRYSLINQPEGISLALIGGTGYGEDSVHIEDSYGNTVKSDTDVYNFYAGPIVSYKINFFEVYTLARVNYLHRMGEHETNDFEEIHFTSDDAYGSAAVGSNIWVTDNIGLTADINAFFNDEEVSEPYANAGIIFRY